MTGLAQQAMEKIDRTRAVAGSALLDILYADVPIPGLPAREELMAIFGYKERLNNENKYKLILMKRGL